MVISQVDFLKFIFKRSQDDQLVTVSEIAAEFQIKTPSVTQALRAMTAKKWLSWEPRKEIHITTQGRSEALKLIRKHRILECFLFQVMQLDLWQVHVEAERLEHVVSDQLILKMNELCGNPQYDPHGHSIPTLAGKFPKSLPYEKLSELPFNKKAKVCLINDHLLSAMQELVKNKIVLGTVIEKKDKNQYYLHGKKVNLSQSLTQLLGVQYL